MENKTDFNLSEERSQGFSKFLLIPLGLVTVLLIGEVGYYFYLQKKLSQKEIVKSPAEVERYFKGVEFYEEVDGEKKFLFFEGRVTDVDSDNKKIVISNNGQKKEISFKEGDLIFVFAEKKENGEFKGFEQKTVFFDQIEIGDKISYSLDDLYERSTWVLQKNEKNN